MIAEVATTGCFAISQLFPRIYLLSLSLPHRLSLPQDNVVSKVKTDSTRPACPKAELRFWV